MFVFMIIPPHIRILKIISLVLLVSHNITWTMKRRGCCCLIGYLRLKHWRRRYFTQFRYNSLLSNLWLIVQRLQQPGPVHIQLYRDLSAFTKYHNNKKETQLVIKNSSLNEGFFDLHRNLIATTLHIIHNCHLLIVVGCSTCRCINITKLNARSLNYNMLHKLKECKLVEDEGGCWNLLSNLHLFISLQLWTSIYNPINNHFTSSLIVHIFVLLFTSIHLQ